MAAHYRETKPLPPRRIPQLLSVIVIALIFVGTAFAFFVTEHAKLRRPLLTDTHVDKQFSPTCRCRQRVDRIAFRLPHRDRITFQIVNAQGRSVTTVVHDRSLPAGLKRFTWSGRDASGRPLPNGVYRPQVLFVALHRRLVLPSSIEIDTTPPRLRRFSIHSFRRRLFAQYAFDQPVQALLFVDGRLAEHTRFPLAFGRVSWAEVFADGRRLAPGRHRIMLAGIDLSGNRSRLSSPLFLTLR